MSLAAKLEVIAAVLVIMMALCLSACGEVEYVPNYPTAHEHVNDGPYYPGDQAYVEVYPESYQG